MGNTQRQRVDEVSIKVNGTQDFTTDTDAFGNIVVNGSILKPHNEFVVEMNGKVTTGLDIFEELDLDSVSSNIFKYQTDYTKAGSFINDYNNRLKVMEDNPYNTALDIMHRLYKDISYVKGSTDVNTTAEKAMEKKCGVCQDYAHIMLSILRLRNIPSKYVVGMFVGEGETHAWVEALSNGRWYGFDPTNDLLIDDNYIKISSGRDATDCSVNKGVFKGFASQLQTVNLVVNKQK